MFATAAQLLTLLATAAIYVRADPDPNSPGPGDVFIEGQPCTIGWTPDPTGTWTNMSIDLMTGDNFNMVDLTTVATVDGTDPSKDKFSFPCPQVAPHSPIYFYQFSSPGTSNKTWTGRFTITDSSQNVVAPVNSIQPNGQNIPWGTGALVNASSSSAPSISGVPAATANGASFAPSIAPGTTPVPTASLSTPSPSVIVTVTSATSAAPSFVSTKAANGAVATLFVSNVVSHAGLALGLAAFGFTMMF